MRFSDYTESEQDAIVRNFKDEEYYNPQYSRFEAQERFYIEIDNLLSDTKFPMEVLSNELYLNAHFYGRDYWELYGSIEFRNEDADHFIEAEIIPYDNYGAQYTKYEFTNVLFDMHEEDMSYGELADIQDKLTKPYEYDLESLVNKINGIADTYGEMAAKGCEMNSEADIRNFLEYNEQGLDLNKYLY